MCAGYGELWGKFIQTGRLKKQCLQHFRVGKDTCIFVLALHFINKIILTGKG